LKYFAAFLTGQGVEAAEDNYFTGFITADKEPVIMMLIFLLIVAIIVFLGVNKGIESSSKIIMPILLLSVIGISIFSLTISHTDAAGVTRTGLEGLKVYIIPNLEGLTAGKLFKIFIDALGQLFFSLSIAMGIMVAYGSYVKDDAALGKSINQIEIFDTAVAFLAGMMIIPAVYTFMGVEGMSAGPSLMFVSLPKIFKAMGTVGNVIGCVFFGMVLFAAITSAMSVMEAIVSSLIDQFSMSRTKACIIEGTVALIGGVVVCLGYNKLYFELKLPNGATAQILDIMDYISNNCLMPVVALLTCILIGWILKPGIVIHEVEKNGQKMGRKKLFVVMIKFVAPIFLIMLLLQTLGVLKL
ncbi:MAG: sodium-dependent transporter, partial [Lachnospiraceae bacterium]|nr:sodium-dependent transporter [Lachnospiraceae bacterium]